MYGNLNWVEDSLLDLGSRGSVGFEAMEKRVDYANSYVRLLERDSITDDSSTFSRVIYELGGNSNQRLTAVLSRPLGKKQDFFLYFDRYSFPGWMINSFSRGTKMGGEYKIRNWRGFNSRVSLEGVIDDREMNGGLSGTSYSISESQSQRDFGSITSDVFLEDSFWRRTHLHAEIELTKGFELSDRFSVDIGVEVAYSRQKFIYQDDSPDSTFYSSYFGDSIDDSLKDSIRFFEVRPTFFVRFDYRVDSNLLLRSESKIKSNHVDYVSNGLSSTFLNLSLEQDLILESDKFNWVVSSEYYFSGFNRGDLGVESVFNMDILDRGLNSKRLGSEFKFKYTLSEPRMVFQFYENELGVNVVDYEKTSSLGGTARLISTFNKLSFDACLEYESMSNAVFFRSDFTSKQYSETIHLVAPSLGLHYKGAVFEANTRATYQVNSQDSIYSLPQWVLRSNFTAKFRLFKKKIGMEIGCDAWYFSDYYARGYLPMVDQMFIQNSQRFGNYIQVDPFMKAQIQRVDISLIYKNATYGLFEDDPIIAPGYPIIPRYLNIVIDWKFKN